MMVDMGSPAASDFFVKDVMPVPADQGWTWTGQNPTFRILALSTGSLKLVADFSIWDVALKQTGPVELSFFINGQLLDKVRYDSAGPKHFEKAIPATWVTSATESMVSVTIDKLWVSPEDGARFGFILSKIGFAP